MKTSELAKKTLQTLKEFGWAQGKLGNCRDGMCIIGAAYYSIHGREPGSGLSVFDAADEEAYGLVCAASVALGGGDLGTQLSSVLVWNDNPNRKFTEVAELLEKIANEQ